MTSRSVLNSAIGLVGAALALLLVTLPEARAACSDPAGMDVDWQDCDLKEVDLSYKILSGANLFNADLSGAGMEGVVLIRANLTGANLSGADLTYADLRDAVLDGADLSSANLTDADFTGTSLSGTVWTDGRACAEGSVGVCE